MNEARETSCKTDRQPQVAEQLSYCKDEMGFTLANTRDLIARLACVSREEEPTDVAVEKTPYVGVPLADELQELCNSIKGLRAEVLDTLGRLEI